MKILRQVRNFENESKSQFLLMINGLCVEVKKKHLAQNVVSQCLQKFCFR